MTEISFEDPILKRARQALAAIDEILAALRGDNDHDEEVQAQGGKKPTARRQNPSEDEGK